MLIIGSLAQHPKKEIGVRLKNKAINKQSECFVLGCGFPPIAGFAGLGFDDFANHALSGAFENLRFAHRQVGASDLPIDERLLLTLIFGVN